MASVRDYIRINPVDLETSKAVGVRFPFNAEGVFYSTYTTAEQVKSNLLNVILTEPGERIFKPNFGVGLRNYLFENFTDNIELEERIRSQVEIYIPEVELKEVSVIKSPDSHILNIAIFYSLRISNEQDAIQINFTPDGALTDQTTQNTVSSPGTSTGGGISSGGGGTSGGGGY